MNTTTPVAGDDGQWSMLSDSSLSFNTIHDRTKRCETAFLNDGTWLADRLAAEAGLDIESDRFTHVWLRLKRGCRLCDQGFCWKSDNQPT
jgi:hypothetical protein